MTSRVTPSTASLFMRRCRQLSTAAPTRTTTRYQSSSASAPAPSTSRYAPSNFSKPYTSPIASSSATSPKASNLPGPGSKPAYATGPLPPARGKSNTSTRTQPLWARPKALSTPIPPPHSQTSFRNWLRRRFGLRIPTTGPMQPTDPFNVWNNPYRAHKKWPPNLRELDHTQQLAFEKTYKRRTALKWERPVFKKWLKLIEYLGIGFIVFYTVMVFDPEEGTVFDGIRAWFWARVKDSELFPERVRGNAADRVERYTKTYQAIKDSFFEIVPIEGMQKGGGVQVDPEEQKIPWAQRKRSQP